MTKKLCILTKIFMQSSRDYSNIYVDRYVCVSVYVKKYIRVQVLLFRINSHGSKSIIHKKKNPRFIPLYIVQCEYSNKRRNKTNLQDTHPSPTCSNYQKLYTCDLFFTCVLYIIMYMYYEKVRKRKAKIIIHTLCCFIFVFITQAKTTKWSDSTHD